MGTPIYISGIRVSGPPLVYIIPRNGVYKIGCTWNLTTRYHGRSQLAEVVHVILVPESMDIFVAERMVHRFFDRKRIDGYAELFDLSTEDLDLAKRLSITERGVEVGN